MKKMLVSLLTLSLCFVVNPLVAHEENDDPNTGPARIKILSPAAGENVRTLGFPLIVSIRGDINGHPDGDIRLLDHVHWGVDVVGGDAISVPITTPDNTGADEILLDLDSPDCEYEICVKLADINHETIGHKECHNFNLVTSGFDLVSPGNNTTVNSFDLNYNLAQYGEEIPEKIIYQVNTHSTSIVENTDGTFSILGLNSGLVEGTNQIIIRGESASGTQIGYTIKTNVMIDSPLNVKNANKILTFAKKMKKSKSMKGKLKNAKKAIKITKNMLTGGTAHPEKKNLTNTNVKKIKILSAKIAKLAKSSSASSIRLKKLINKIKKKATILVQ